MAALMVAVSRQLPTMRSVGSGRMQPGMNVSKESRSRRTSVWLPSTTAW